MKKVLIMIFALVLTLGLSSLALAVGDGTGIIGSAHDFTDGVSPRGGAIASPDSWNTSGELCRVCHVPHDHGVAGQRYLNGLLWNRDVSTESYSMYNNSWSASIDNPQASQPEGISKLCLSCHDGSIAIDRFDVYAGDPNNSMRNIYGGALQALVIPAGTPGNLDLKGTHPLSIRFDPANDPLLNDPNSTVMGTSGNIIDVLDLDQRVQCSSCHDVHNQESAPGTNFLRVAQNIPGNPSALCRTCHIK